MKIKSITNVITNSSSEVFILNTSDVDSVKEFLKDIKGCGDPLITGSEESGVLDELMDYSYLYDPNDPNSVRKYVLNTIPEMVNKYWDDKNNYIIEGCENKKFIVHEWVEFCRKNLKEINSLQRKWGFKDLTVSRIKQINYNKYRDTLFPSLDMDDIVYKFYTYFIAKFPGKVPKAWKTIPDYLTIQYWKGKVGFGSLFENSISYEDYSKILNKFGGQHWHMG